MNRYTGKKNSIYNQIGIIISFWVMQIPFMVSDIYNSVAPIYTTTTLMMLSGGICFFLILLNLKKININSISKVVVFCFLSLVVIPSGNIILTFLIKSDALYLSVVGNEVISRIVNYVVCISFFLVLCQILNGPNIYTKKMILSVYLFAVGIFLFVGVWQWFAFVFHVPFINISTRSDVYGIVSERMLFNFRLTSLAMEPSYLAPLCIDGLLLCNLIMSGKCKIIYTAISIFVLLFSFSGGGYVEITILLATYLWLNRKKKGPLLFIIMGCFLILLLSLSFGEMIIGVFSPILERKRLFSMESSRIYMVIMPFLWIWEGNWNNWLFGYGPGTYAYLSVTKKLPSGLVVHKTSNNILTDNLWESGIFGIVMLLYMFLRLLHYSYQKNVEKSQLSLFLMLHILLSSMYRADFASLRFWFILAIICNVKQFLPLLNSENV